MSRQTSPLQKNLLTAFKYGPMWYPNRNLRSDISDTLICSANSTVFNFYNKIFLISVCICFILNSLFVLMFSQFYDRISCDLLWWSFVLLNAVEFILTAGTYSCHRHTSNVYFGVICVTYYTYIITWRKMDIWKEFKFTN